MNYPKKWSGPVTVALLLFTATAATADETLPFKTWFSGDMVLPWVEGVNTYAPQANLTALGETGLWSQLPLATREKYEGIFVFDRPRLAAVVARDRAVKVVSMLKRDDDAVVISYTIAAESAQGAHNVHVFEVPRYTRLFFQETLASKGKRARRGVAVGLAGRLAGESKGSTGSHAPSRGPVQIEVCHRYECEARKSITLPESAWRDVDALFAVKSVDASEERLRISKSIGLIEGQVGPLAGTSKDRGSYSGNTDGEGWTADFGGPKGAEGHQDCIDEAANTTTYLGLMVRRGLIRFHRPESRARRSYGRAWHYAASIRDLQDNQAYAVDSWVRDNGQPAVVELVKSWGKLPKGPIPSPVIDRPLGEDLGGDFSED